MLKIIFGCLDLCNTHTAGNIARFNYSVIVHKLESAPGL